MYSKMTFQHQRLHVSVYTKVYTGIENSDHLSHRAPD